MFTFITLAHHVVALSTMLSAEPVDTVEEARAWHGNHDLAGKTITNIDVIPDEVVIFADIHGDNFLFNVLLHRGGIIDDDANWIDGNPFLNRYMIQLGDVVDRGPESKSAYKLIEALRQQVGRTNDEVFSLYGNHELFLLCNVLNYFSRDEIDKYYQGDVSLLVKDYGPGGAIGKELRQNYLPALKLSDTIFVHAGFDDLFRYVDFKDIKTELLKIIREGCPYSDDNVTGNMGPFWTRKVSNGFDTPESSSSTCDYVSDLSDDMKVEKFIVGHTPTSSGSIEVHCDGSWIMHDTAMSRWMGMGGNPRYSVMYKSMDASGRTLPLSQWLHVQWEPVKGNTDLPLKGTFLNAGTLDENQQEKFMSNRLEIYAELKKWHKNKQSRREIEPETKTTQATIHSHQSDELR